MMNKGMSDAQSIKEAELFSPDMPDEESIGLSGTIQSVQKGKNPTITITVPCEPKDVQNYHIGQSVSVMVDEDDNDVSMDSGFGGE